MEYILNAIKQGKSSSEIRKELQVVVSLRQDTTLVIEKGIIAKEKLIINLMKSWIDVPPNHVSLRDTLVSINSRTYIPHHWIVISLAYPFWFNVATIVGRLLYLQSSFNHRQLLTRMKEIYGDRETVQRCTRHVLRSICDWGCIKEIDRRTGQYGRMSEISVSDPALISFFLEMVLTNFERKQISLSEFYSHPSLFPFSLHHYSGSELIKHDSKLLLSTQNTQNEIVTFEL